MTTDDERNNIYLFDRRMAFFILSFFNKLSIFYLMNSNIYIAQFYLQFSSFLNTLAAFRRWDGQIDKTKPTSFKSLFFPRNMQKYLVAFTALVPKVQAGYSFNLWKNGEQKGMFPGHSQLPVCDLGQHHQPAVLFLFSEGLI